MKPATHFKKLVKPLSVRCKTGKYADDGLVLKVVVSTIPTLYGHEMDMLVDAARDVDVNAVVVRTQHGNTLAVLQGKRGFAAGSALQEFNRLEG